MLIDGEGLESGVKFSVAATYEKFNSKWDIPIDKLRWVDLWSSILEPLSVEEINTVADHCVKEFRRPPVPIEFIKLAKRIRTGQPLTDPLVSKVERIAHLILNSTAITEENFTQSELSDAFLIAGAIAHSKSYAEVLPEI